MRGEGAPVGGRRGTNWFLKKSRNLAVRRRGVNRMLLVCARPDETATHLSRQSPASRRVQLVRQVVVMMTDELLVGPPSAGPGPTDGRTSAPLAGAAARRFVAVFPERLEKRLEKWDNAVIALVQRPSLVDKSLLARCVLLLNDIPLVLTSVEFVVAWPFCLLLTGYDSAGLLALHVSFLLALITQIPKRFLWRARPWVVGRARGLRRNTTSAFPSRAVSCAVCASFMLCAGWFLERGRQFSVWYPVLVLLATLWTSYSRVHCGDHYPSDCLFGALQGLLIVALGVLSYLAGAAVCGTCAGRNAPCHVQADSEQALTGLGQISMLGLFCIVFIDLAAYFISVSKPIEFWEKSHGVFGMLLPCYGLQLLALCGARHSAVPPPRNRPAWIFVLAAVQACLAAALGMSTKKGGWRSACAFVTIYSANSASLLCWRTYGSS